MPSKRVRQSDEESYPNNSQHGVAAAEGQWMIEGLREGRRRLSEIYGDNLRVEASWVKGS